MSIYSLPSLFSALLILVPLSIAIRNFNQSFQIRLLVFFLCQLFLYMFAEFCLVHSSGPTIALFWDKTIYFAISFMPATYLHIILRYRKAGPLSPLLLCLIYTPTILFISLLFTPLLVSGVQPEAWGYGKIEGPAFALFRAYLMLYLILNISILIYKYRNESDPRVRIGLCYFGLAYTVPMLATLIIVIILQPLGITSYNIGALAISIAALAAITSYAIIKHQLFDIPLIWGKFMNTERYRFIERFRLFVSRLYHTPRPLPDLVDEMSELFGCDVAFNIHGQPAWASGGSDAFRAFQPDFDPVGKDRQERQYRTAMEEIDHKMIYLLGETQKGLDEIDRAMNENGVEGLVHLNSGGKTLGVIKFGKGFSKNIYSGADHALLRKLTLLILMAVNYQRLMEEKLALKDARIAQLNADIERLRDSSRFPSPPDQISPAKIPPSVALDRVTLSKTGEDAFISASPRIQEIVEQLNTAARGARSILITGETGTGKEVLARHIAELSGRSPLVVVNCSAIPEHLFESEFFGHVKGAFTSAHAYRQGKLVQADGGILFLDEVGDMPLSSQAKLLRVLEGHPFTPIGGSTDVHVSVLFLAATNRDLPALVSSGKCRADLYDRLSIFSVHLPPLQDRQEDIPYLARYFLDRANRQYSKGCSFSRRFFAQLMAHHYTGHVRELRNIIDKAVISSPGQGLLRSFDAAPLAPSLPISRDVRRLLRVMAENGWKQYKAAKALGITPAAMSARIRKHGLDYVSLLRAVQAAELPYED